jgi:opacity protein-like surface antigen
MPERTRQKVWQSILRADNAFNTLEEGAMFKTIVAVTFISALGVGGAVAADLVFEPPAVDDPAVSDWDGVYAGLVLDAWHWIGPIPENAVGLGGVVGVNATADRFLFGAEAFASGYVGDAVSSGWFAGGEVRGGYLATPDILLYAGLGGIHFSGTANYITYGVGAEFMATENLSIDLEYKYWDQVGGPYVGHNVSASALWHF